VPITSNMMAKARKKYDIAFPILPALRPRHKAD